MQESTKESEILKRVLQAIGNPPGEVYAPSDDSFLMVSAIPTGNLAGKNVLDLGTGSGVLGLYCALQGALVTLSDIDGIALQHAREVAKSLGVDLDTTKSDLFSNVCESFDLVLFNPPYLPSVTVKDRAIDGGLMGADVIRRFLLELPSHLKKDGTALMLVSSVNDIPSLLQEYSEFEFSPVAKRPLFFEELQVLRVRFRDSLTRQ
ncbi:MAG: HemK2/MTQ2 family protein methyltransferase [Candidatus Bathyarchaeia archaeon]|jgi:release factor glutamine methyltransferase